MRLGDFESLFVTDLERGQLLSSDSYVGLEGISQKQFFL